MRCSTSDSLCVSVSVSYSHGKWANTQGKADAPRNFERAVWVFFEALGFTQDPHEKSMWVRGLGTEHEIIVVAFCDDFIIAANSEASHRKFEIELTGRWGDCEDVLRVPRRRKRIVVSRTLLRTPSSSAGGNPHKKRTLSSPVWVHNVRSRHNFERHEKVLPTCDDLRDRHRRIRLVGIYPFLQ